MRKNHLMLAPKTIRLFVAGAAFAAWAFCAPANAEEFEVTIHHLEVPELGVSPKVGDTIVFHNHADISHNLYVTYEDGEVETLDTQPPRTDKRLTLKREGRAIVKCWIHPIIRMEMNVAPR